MSWYYDYYLVEKRPDGKIYFSAPFDKNGKPICIISESRSFSSDLNDCFRPVKRNELSNELTTYLFGSDEECINEMLKYVDYIPIKEL